MEPAPPSLYKCPHCEAYYKRENWASENSFGATLWSDGVLTDGMMGAEYDCLVRCCSCQNVFAANQALVKNGWESQWPEGIKIYGSGSVTIEEAVSSLLNQNLLKEVGAQYGAFRLDKNLPDYENKALQSGKFQVRFMIWRKLNDEIREAGRLAAARHQLLLENAVALIPLMPTENMEFDQSPLLWKAELHRNLGEFFNSIKTLLRVNQRSMLKTKRKMIFLNLIRNKRLVPLSTAGRRWRKHSRVWKAWLFGSAAR